MQRLPKVTHIFMKSNTYSCLSAVFDSSEDFVSEEIVLEDVYIILSYPHPIFIFIMTSL